MAQRRFARSASDRLLSCTAFAHTCCVGTSLVKHRVCRRAIDMFAGWLSFGSRTRTVWSRVLCAIGQAHAGCAFFALLLAARSATRRRRSLAIARIDASRCASRFRVAFVWLSSILQKSLGRWAIALRGALLNLQRRLARAVARCVFVIP